MSDSTNPIKQILLSRKFLLALLGFVNTIVSHYLKLPTEVWAAVDALLLVVIAGIAYEDGQQKSQPITVENVENVEVSDQ